MMNNLISISLLIKNLIMVNKNLLMKLMIKVKKNHYFSLIKKDIFKLICLKALKFITIIYKISWKIILCRVI